MPVVNWLKRHLVVIAGLVTLAYLLLPNVIVTVFSFNKPKGRFNYEWQQFSTDAWKDPCGVADMCGSLSISLQIALWATLGATVLGTMIAFALVRYRFRARGTVNSLIFLPMAMPEVVMAASLLTLFLNMGAQLGFYTILIAHIMFCISFVVVTVRARLAGLSDTLEQAAMDLYATPQQTFWRVTFPLAFPGILGAALLSFSLSFDDFIITNLNAGQTVTFPMFVYGAAQRGVPMQVNVIGTLMFVIAIVIVLGNEYNSRRRARALAS